MSVVKPRIDDLLDMFTLFLTAVMLRLHLLLNILQNLKIKWLKSALVKSRL